MSKNRPVDALDAEDIDFEYLAPFGLRKALLKAERAYPGIVDDDVEAGMRRGRAAMHVIDETSPLHGHDGEALAKHEAEIEISLIGLDDATMQTVYSQHVYSDDHIKFGHRFADTIKPLPGGDMILDLTQFDVTVPGTVPRDSVAA